MTNSVEEHIVNFCTEVSLGHIAVYNEFSLQHELGIYFRTRLLDCRVEFERNISHFKFPKENFVKREIDISISSHNGELISVIELKFPRNGQYPESMFGFCKDIAFLEQLSEAGFTSAYFLAFADDKLFYSGDAVNIYEYFRGKKPIAGLIVKPTGAKDATINIKGVYSARWETIDSERKYCLINVG